MRGHDTDRFSKAIEQLGSRRAPVRLGSPYALEQLLFWPGIRLDLTGATLLDFDACRAHRGTCR